jgi:WD40 repeat protein
MPKNVFSVKSSSGIFSLHCKDEFVVTGNKDGTVGYSQITENSINLLKNYESLHSGVVKSVKLKDVNVIALGGNERVIRVADFRLRDPTVVTINDTHEYCINSVSWNPTNKNLLMSSSFGTKNRFHVLTFSRY